MKNAVVVANGTHADMIAERMEDGSSPLDALGLSLLAFGYERDELKTPRIAGVMRDAEGWLGIAKDGELRAKRFSLEDGDAFYVATYERTEFEPIYIAGDSALALAKASFGLPFERPVCSAAALQDEDGFKLAVYNPR
jgi:IMP cyclohydrolase